MSQNQISEADIPEIDPQLLTDIDIPSLLGSLYDIQFSPIHSPNKTPTPNPVLVSSSNTYSKPKMTESSDERIAKILSQSLSKNLHARAPKIEDFSGEEYDDIMSWLEQFNFAAEAQNWDDSDKIKKIGQYLKGEAFEWYRMNVRDNPDRSAVDKFDKISKMLIADYNPVDAEEFYRVKLDEIKQKHMAVGHYLLKVRTLCHRVDKNMKEEMIMRHMFRGMDPKLAQKVYACRPADSKELMKRAKEIETSKSLFPDDEEQKIDSAVNKIVESFKELKLRDRSESIGRRANSLDRDDYRTRVKFVPNRRNFMTRSYENLRKPNERQSRMNGRMQKQFDIPYMNYEEKPREQRNVFATRRYDRNERFRNDRRNYDEEKPREQRNVFAARRYERNERFRNDKRNYGNRNNDPGMEGNDTRNERTVKCYNCGKNGHYARNCFLGKGSQDARGGNSTRMANLALLSSNRRTPIQQKSRIFRKKIDTEEKMKKQKEENRKDLSNQLNEMTKRGVMKRRKVSKKSNGEYFPSIDVIVNHFPLLAFCDTGSESCLISLGAASEIGLKMKKYIGPDIVSAKSKAMGIVGEITVEMRVPWHNECYNFLVTLIVVRHLAIPLILGKDFMEASGFWVSYKSLDIGFMGTPSKGKSNQCCTQHPPPGFKHRPLKQRNERMSSMIVVRKEKDIKKRANPLLVKLDDLINKKNSDAPRNLPHSKSVVR